MRSLLTAVFSALVFVLSAMGQEIVNPAPVTTPTPIQTSSPASPTSPTAGGEITPLKISDREYQTFKQQNEQQIKTLTDKITAFEATIRNAQSLDQKVAGLDGKVDALQKLDGLRYNQQIEFDKIQYEAGADTLERMLNSMGKLDFTLAFQSSIASFQDSTNPLTNTTFNREIDALRGNNLESKNSSLPDIVQPLLANPYISMAWSIGSVLVSKLPNNQAKSDKFKKLLCIVDMSTKTNADMSIMKGELAALHQRVKNFNAANENLFSSYTQAINKPMTVQQYRNQFGGIKESTKTYFAQYKSDGNSLELREPPSSLKNVRYNIGLVRANLVEFDMIIKGMSDFLENFDQVLTKYQTVENCQGLDSRSQLTTLKESVNANKSRFKEVYGQDILPELRSILNGIN